MSSSSGFQVTLPSNTQTSVFPNNTTSDYEIPLLNPIDFGGVAFEVALTEIFLPHTWYNIPEEMRTVVFQWVPYGKDGRAKHTKEKKIPQGHYETAEELVNVIDSLKPQEFKGKIFLRPVNNLVHISMVGWQALFIEKRLAALLGFRENLDEQHLYVSTKRVQEDYFAFDHTKTDHKQIYRAKYMCDTDPTMHAVFCYCSVIKESLVGVDYLPLLRLIPTTGQHGTMIHLTFDNPFYVDVAYDRISSIRLTLCNDQGEPIKFTAGKTICRLHFRPKNSPYL